MACYIIVHYVIVYCMVLYFIIPYYLLLYCNISVQTYDVILYCIILYYIAQQSQSEIPLESATESPLHNSGKKHWTSDTPFETTAEQ